MPNNSAITYWSIHALDRSTGQPDALSGVRHPAGFFGTVPNPQFWSDTASQWNAEYRAQYNIGHDTAGQNPSGPAPIAAARAPNGWASGQAFSSSAQQWHDMWAAEWQNARDQSGLAYSYPGQPAWTVFWWQSASYWKGQADFFWGATRQYGNGETWEQAYNRVLPYSGPLVYDSGLFQTSNDTGGSYVTLGTVTVGLTGYYDVIMRGNGNNFASNGNCAWRVLIGGGQADSGSGGSGWSGDIGQYWRGFLGAGTQIAFQGQINNQGFSGGISGHLYAVFIPTPANPH
jgi:hypothetical protein